MRAPDMRLSVAPMMDRTDRHFRYFMRRITRGTLLYSEMVTTGALIHGDRTRFLAYQAEEHPIALQLGGDSPEDLARCAQMAEDAGYDEVNINVGCPSDRVQNGSFGACLMARPERVAEAVGAMRTRVSIPVTVKHRIGIDQNDSYEFMRTFVDTVAEAGCTRFIAHARIAVLGGLTPKQNRTVPPLRYNDVYRLKSERPDLEIGINGGVLDLVAATEHLQQVDGVMIGRAAYDDPYLFAGADPLLGAGPGAPDRFTIAESMVPYIERHVANGGRVHDVTRHMMGLFTGQPGARAFRRYLSENVRPDSDASVLSDALRRLLDRSGVDAA